MKILVSGSRKIKDRYKIYIILNTIRKIYGIDEIIHGGASGVDTITGKYFKRNGVNVTEVRPDWEKYGNGAGLKRNTKMVIMCDGGVCIWDGKSRGTMNTMEKLKGSNKLLCVFKIKPKSD